MLEINLFRKKTWNIFAHHMEIRVVQVCLKQTLKTFISKIAIVYLCQQRTFYNEFPLEFDKNRAIVYSYGGNSSDLSNGI